MAALRIQNLVHWMEMGKGRKISLVVTLLVFVSLFTVYHCYKRYRGPGSESVIEQALLAKNLARGKGFTTTIIYPQTVAFLESRNAGAGREKYIFDSSVPLPELYHAPLYAITLAAGMKVADLLPFGLNEWVWADPEPTSANRYPYFNADYLVLAVNVIFFWLSCALVFILGRRIFSAQAGIVMLLGMVFSIGIWDHVLGVTGMALLCFLTLLFFDFWSRLVAEQLQQETISIRRIAFWSIGIGVAAGLMFLTEYTSAMIYLVFLVSLGITCRGRSLVASLLPALAAFLLIISPWCTRNFMITGHPMGLAGWNVFLKQGDSSAEPIAFRKSMNPDRPEISLKKVANKGLSGIEANLTTHFWAGGAYVFTAFFLAGCLYRFRNGLANHMRWCAVLSIVLLLIAQPFLNSGESERLPVFYMTPLIIVFGTGFFLIMLESTGRKGVRERIVYIAILLLFQGLPMLHNLSEPRRVPFRYPPYVPSLMSYMRTHLLELTHPLDYGVMADIPAGLAWYSQQPVWAQPGDYADFVQVFVRQDIAALLLSPSVLGKPYFAKLLRADLDIGERFADTRYWGAVYGGLQSRKIPVFFPLRRINQLSMDMYVLLNELAWPK